VRDKAEEEYKRFTERWSREFEQDPAPRQVENKRPASNAGPGAY